MPQNIRKAPSAKGPQPWTLTSEALQRFLSLLDPDCHKAALEYERIRSKLLTFFRSRGCWDPEHCADETIDRTIRRIDEVESLIPFIRGVARWVAVEEARNRPRLLGPEGLDRLAADNDRDSDNADTERRLGYLDRCLELLTPNDREFILAYYGHGGASKAQHKRLLAESLNVSAGNLRIRAFRLRREVLQAFRASMPEVATT